MESLQESLTVAAIVVEYLFFGYLALAFMLYAFQRQWAENRLRRGAMAAQAVPAPAPQSAFRPATARSHVPTDVAEALATTG